MLNSAAACLAIKPLQFSTKLLVRIHYIDLWLYKLGRESGHWTKWTVITHASLITVLPKDPKCQSDQELEFFGLRGMENFQAQFYLKIRCINKRVINLLF